MKRRRKSREPSYEALPAEGSRWRKVAVVLTVMVALVAATGFGVQTWYERQLDPSGPPGEPVEVTIPRGTTKSGVAGVLEQSGVVGNAAVFGFWLRSKELAVQAGEFTFRENSSFQRILEVLRGGPAPAETAAVTIPEGLTLTEMVDIVTERVARFRPEAFEASLANPEVRSRYQPAEQPSKEGLLFPSTYEIAADETETEFVGRLITEMDQVLTELGAPQGPTGAAPVPELSAYQVVTVASLIEEETGNPGESPRIARVIYNRLANGEPLGIDATSRYLAEQTGAEIDFSSDSPYNTRRVPGLPPTPIAAPGRDSLEAALSPATGPWTFYVLEAPDSHFFTDDASEFRAAKERCEARGLGCG